VRERPEDVGGDRAAEMGVQLGETAFDHARESTSLHPGALCRKIRVIVTGSDPEFAREALVLAEVGV
jgi:hypothetical protein